MAVLNDSLCPTDHDEFKYSYPLEIAASAGARLSTPEKLVFSDKERCKIMQQKRRETSHVRFSPSERVLVG